MRYLMLAAAFSSFAIAGACSSSPSNGDGGSDATSDVTQQNDATSNDTGVKDAQSDVTMGTDASDAGGSDASDASDGSGGMLTLTVHDYLNWCNVTVNGVGPSTMDPQTYMFAPSTMVTAVGDTANASVFYWGYWGNVAPDGGLADGGQDTSKTVKFVITKDTTLNACCPDNGSPLTECTF